MFPWTLFRSRTIPVADTHNEAGGSAYALSPKQALAQLAATSCLNHSFYTGRDEQLRRVLDACAAVEAGFIARTAVWARREGGMKDLPALLCAVLAARDGAALEAVFDRVIDRGGALRTFVQVLRSGVTGRRSLGSRPRRLVRAWLESRSDEALVHASIGTRPSLADVLRLAHPSPTSPARRALHAWILGGRADPAHLPEAARALDAFRRDPSAEPPDLPMEWLTSQPLRADQWACIATRTSWQVTRQHLATFARHGAFEFPGVVDAVARKLADRDAMRRGRGTPMQVLAAIAACDERIPDAIADALVALLDATADAVSPVPDRLWVCPDVSGSMLAPLTGVRTGATTRVRVVDAAAVITAMLVRRNPCTRVLPFEWRAAEKRVAARSSVAALAGELAALGGGGTNCAAPLAWLNERREACGGVLLLSDNASWACTRTDAPTPFMEQWQRLKSRCPQARLVCLDLQPGGSSQAVNRGDALNVGGWSDASLELALRFLRGERPVDAWVQEIEAVSLS